MPDPPSKSNPPGGDAAYAPGFPPGINWLVINPRLSFPLPIIDGIDAIGCSDDADDVDPEGVGIAKDEDGA